MVLHHLFGTSQQMMLSQLLSQATSMIQRILDVSLVQMRHKVSQHLQRKPHTQLHTLRKTGETPTAYEQLM